VKNSVKVAPSIISANMLKLSEEIEILERSGADMIHIDVYPLMVFAFEYRELANVTIGTLLLDFLRKRTSLPLEVHLAIEVDGNIITEYIKLGADIITFHPEVIDNSEDIGKIIDTVKKNNIKLGLATSVSSDLAYIKKYAKYADLILLTTSNPNFSGKIKIQESENKIIQIRNLIGNEIDLAVDGGVDDEVGPKFVKCGASILVVGKYIFKSKNYLEAIRRLKDKCIN
jgi:ribulose-phosphate 3-epimerase